MNLIFKRQNHNFTIHFLLIEEDDDDDDDDNYETKPIVSREPGNIS